MSDSSPRWRASPLIRASITLHLLLLIAVAIAPQHWPWWLVILIANHATLTVFGLWPRSHALGPNWTQLPPAATARREIALTLDDSPDPEVTPQVLDVLDGYGVKATFFCIGERATRHPDLCRAIVRRGHDIENHSQHHHWHFSLLGLRGFEREIRVAQDTLAEITGQAPRFFRAPAGLRNPFLDPVLTRLGLQLASWSIRAFDTRERDAGRVLARLLNGLRPGAILLLHDGNAARTPSGTPVVLDVLPALLEAARAAGLRWVTLREAMR